MVKSGLKFVNVGRVAGKDRMLEGVPKISQHCRTVVGNHILPVDAILL